MTWNPVPHRRWLQRVAWRGGTDRSWRSLPWNQAVDLVMPEGVGQVDSRHERAAVAVDAEYRCLGTGGWPFRPAVAGKPSLADLGHADDDALRIYPQPAAPAIVSRQRGDVPGLDGHHWAPGGIQPMHQPVDGSEPEAIGLGESVMGKPTNKLCYEGEAGEVSDGAVVQAGRQGAAVQETDMVGVEVVADLGLVEGLGTELGR